jgi:threonine synthase
MGPYHLICTDCGRRYDPREIEYLCPDCEAQHRDGECLRGVLRVEYTAPFADLLPIPDPGLLPPVPLGPTPLLDVPRLRERLGLPRLFLKDETRLPTGSLKDRASALVIAKARELGHTRVTTASTGNAAIALAGLGAASGLHSVIFVPAGAPRAKLAQLALYGATVLPIDGTYDDAFALCLAAGREFGFYNRSTAYNPYTIEGKKTVAFEIFEQCGARAPDAIFVPTGDGAILAGVHKGFTDLIAAGRCAKLPRLFAVQAEGSAAIVAAWRSGADAVTPLERVQTIADSIRVACPANGRWALRALRESGGAGVTVSDAQILSAMLMLGGRAGLFAEPAAAAALAGLLRAQCEELIDASALIVVLVTGTGLKDIETMRAITPAIPALAPTLAAVRERLTPP